MSTSGITDLSPLEVLPLGVGDTFTARHNTTALLLRFQGEYLAVDCPDSYLRVLAQSALTSGWKLDAFDIPRMLITHVHGDHVNGLEGLAFFKHFVGHQKLSLLCVPEVREVLWEQRLKAAMHQLWDGAKFRTMRFEDYFDHVPLPWEAETDVGPFSIRVKRTLHHVPTSALLIRAGGRCLGYSADTAFDPELIEFLREADLILHETNHGPAHTPYEKLLSLEPEVRAKMRLIHYADNFDADGSAITVAREGFPLRV